MPAGTKQELLDWDTSAFFGTSKGEKTKARILYGAIQVLGTEGYGTFTFDSVGKPLGLKRAQVAYHFPDKQDLVATAIRVVYQFGGAIVEAEMAKAIVSPSEHMRAYLRGTLQWLLQYRSVSSTVTLALYLATINPAYAQVMADVKKTGVQRVERILSGFFRDQMPNKKIRETAVIVHAYIVGTVVDLMTSSDFKGSLEDQEQSMYQHIERILGIE